MAEIGVISDQSLFSQTKMTGNCARDRHHEGLMGRPLARRSVAERHDDHVPDPESCAASATPFAIGRPAPTIEFSPRKRCSGDDRYADPPRPPFVPVGAPEDLGEERHERDLAGDRPAVAAIGRYHPILRLERRQCPDRDRFLPTAEMHRAGDLIGEPELEHALLEPADRQHPR